MFRFSTCLVCGSGAQIRSRRIKSVRSRLDQICTSWIEEAQSGLGRLGSTRQIGKMATRIVIVIFAGFTLLLNLMLLLLIVYVLYTFHGKLRKR